MTLRTTLGCPYIGMDKKLGASRWNHSLGSVDRPGVKVALGVHRGLLLQRAGAGVHKVWRHGPGQRTQAGHGHLEQLSVVLLRGGWTRLRDDFQAGSSRLCAGEKQTASFQQTPDRPVSNSYCKSKVNGKYFSQETFSVG